MKTEELRERQMQLEIGMMRMVRDFEDETSLRITSAKMVNFDEDTRYFSTMAFLTRKSRKKHGQ